MNHPEENVALRLTSLSDEHQVQMRTIVRELLAVMESKDGRAVIICALPHPADSDIEMLVAHSINVDVHEAEELLINFLATRQAMAESTRIAPQERH